MDDIFGGKYERQIGVCRQWFGELQDRICNSMIEIENEYCEALGDKVDVKKT